MSHEGKVGREARAEAVVGGDGPDRVRGQGEGRVREEGEATPRDLDARAPPVDALRVAVGDLLAEPEVPGTVARPRTLLQFPS